jgi:hypothetical protein
VGARAGVNAGQNRVGANAQLDTNVNGFGQTPFFADPGVRQQLRMTDAQFNRLSRAHLNALRRANRNANVNGAANSSARAGIHPNGTGTATAPGVTQTTPGTTGSAATGTADQSGVTGNVTDPRAQTGVAGATNPGTTVNDTSNLTRSQDDFESDFDGTVDSTFTDPAMRQRFNQLNLQHQGIGAFLHPQIQRQLNLTAQQRQQLRSLAGEWRNQLRALQTGQRSNLTADQWNALRSQFNARLNTVLTPQQQQQWATMIGDVYNFPMSAFVQPDGAVSGSNTTAGANTAAAGNNIDRSDNGSQGSTNTPGSDGGRIAPFGGTSRSSQNQGTNSGTVR